LQNKDLLDYKISLCQTWTCAADQRTLTFLATRSGRLAFIRAKKKRL